MKKLKILQVFSRYLEYGGEELIAGRLEDALAEQHEMYRYVGSTEKLIEGGPFNKALIPFRTRYNTIVENDLKKEQASNQHDLWIVHNIFPALSPSVYAVAKELHVPIVHYLHNYRMSCANGYFLNHGKPCERCAQGNFWPALKTGCWRDSRATSGWMGSILQDMRKNDVFHQVRRWVTPSESQKNIHIRMGLPASRIDVVPYFIEAQETFSPVPENGDVLFLGRLSQEKGVENLLRAWALCSAGKRKLVIAGTGKEEKALRALAKVLKLENVNFVGFVTREQQPELWAKTSFSVIPSIWNEPFPLSFMEAWKNGRPFVGSRLGAMSEVLQDGGGGLLADPFSPEDLAKQITYLLQHQEESRRLGEVGHRKILSLYNKQKWLDRFNRVLEDAINPIKTIPTQATRPSSTIFHACTLFDTGFLAKGLALFRSLRRQGTPFHLYVFAMDDFTAQYLKSLAEPEITVIPIIDFEGPELLRIKPTRSRAEYYWTCGSSSVAYVLKNFSVESCTYLDADVYFYAPPQEIEALIGDASIGITPHQYSAPYDQNRLHGVYCVQYVTFRNDERGLQALRWWSDKCIEWCFALPDAGRFGDQKYLDDWPERFAGVKILDTAGIGLAPWNCRDYQLMKCAEGGFMVRNKSDGETGRLSFFHFHELRFFTKDRIKLVAGGYEVSEEVLQQCYGPYIRELVQIANEIKQKHPSANPLGVQPPNYKKMLMAKMYAAINPRFHDHYISTNKALGL